MNILPFVLLTIPVVALGFGAPAGARLHEIPGNEPVHHVSAIHRPTGCMAQLDYQQDMPMAAYITDPLCLPEGVKKRRIPLDPSDFHIPASRREIIRTR